MLCISAEKMEKHNSTHLLSSFLYQCYHNNPPTVFLLFFVFL